MIYALDYFSIMQISVKLFLYNRSEQWLWYFLMNIIIFTLSYMHYCVYLYSQSNLPLSQLEMIT